MWSASKPACCTTWWKTPASPLTRSTRTFGKEVANCVNGVTKLTKLDFFSAEERQAESFRKMLLAMTDDIRVIIVKLADRLHNMRTLGALSPERKERIARETHGDLRADRAPPRYGQGPRRAGGSGVPASRSGRLSRSLRAPSKSKRGDNEQFLIELRKKVEERAGGAKAFRRAWTSRVKRAYSVYLKMKRQKIPIEQVYDLLALRIITDSVKNCYAALGVIHKEWRPVPGRIKDFIAIPRPNLYQSLHTSVFGPEGRHFEVQIRTEEMHRIAEEGIAAHWKYKEGRKGMAAGRPAHRLAAAPGGVAERGAGFGRVPLDAQGGSLSGGGLCVHAARAR